MHVLCSDFNIVCCIGLHVQRLRKVLIIVGYLVLARMGPELCIENICSLDTRNPILAEAKAKNTTSISGRIDISSIDISIYR